ncbi:hypothetical protein CEXT_350911 [Caerostris extrusa]|uniref:Uncharacterized protein n=1 Tax=Caerostris extrusa TaxID=172846 RepID=A0AAV4QB01_CAEEX|nr:hypothetical protein CEXT_350911 [Caerostris extrusa]
MSASVVLTPKMSFLESSTHPRPTPMTLFDPLAVFDGKHTDISKKFPQTKNDAVVISKKLVHLRIQEMDQPGGDREKNQYLRIEGQLDGFLKPHSARTYSKFSPKKYLKKGRWTGLRNRGVFW